MYTKDNHKSFTTPQKAEFEIIRSNESISVIVKTEEKNLKAEIEQRITLLNYEKRIDIDNTLYHVKDMVNDNRYYRYIYYAFPFSVDNCRRYCHLNGAVAEYAKDVTGHGTDVYMAVNEWCCSENDDFGVALFMKDSHITEFDHIHPDKTDYANAGNGSQIFSYVANDWLLLPQGTYSFRPYYTTIYGEGEKVSLATQLVNIPDPGVTMTLHGNTSYDKYLAGNSTPANVHTNTKIEGVAVSTNLDLSLISKYSADIDGTDLGTGSITTGSESKASYGDLTRTDYRSYVFSAHITCGKLSFSASRTFHITGLPYEVDFNKGINSSWGTIGNAEYSDSRMTIAYTGDGAICSPAFYLPANTFVNTSVDVSTKSSELLYIQPCVANASVFSKGTASITPHKVGTFGSLEPSTYISCSTVLILTSTNCSLMYAATAPFLNNIAIYKVKIEYN